jgi:hypothetical protein
MCTSAVALLQSCCPGWFHCIPWTKQSLRDRLLKQETEIVEAGSGRKLLLTTGMNTADTYTSLVASSRGFSSLAIASFQRSSDRGSPLVDMGP